MTQEEYSKKKAEIENRIQNLKEELRTLKQEYAFMLTNIRVGDKISFGVRDRKEGVVSAVKLWCGDTSVIFEVNLLKKDGSPSRRCSTVYKSDNPQKIEE